MRADFLDAFAACRPTDRPRLGAEQCPDRLDLAAAHRPSPSTTRVGQGAKVVIWFAPQRSFIMAGKIRIGIGGWTFEPWRGVFYPDDLTQKRELEYASRKLTSIEINGTYYSSFKPASWAKWRAETPDGFVFAMKRSEEHTSELQSQFHLVCRLLLEK